MTRKSLTQRLFKDGLHIGKYLAAATVALSLFGCDHLPKPISASEDGRFITYSATETGGFHPLGENYNEATMVLYDTQQKRVVNTFEINSPPIWPTNTGDTVAYMETPVEGAFHSRKSSVVVYSGGKKEIIENAAYPELSSDGRYLVYTGRRDSSQEPVLILREREAKQERNLGITGMCSDFSPDTKSLVYLIFERQDKDRVCLFVETQNLITGEKKRFGEVNTFNEEISSSPRWIDNNRILYSGKAKEGTDSEIFIGNQDGSLTQVTNNEIEEYLVEMTPDGQIFYQVFDPKDFNINHYIAKQTIMGWTSQEGSKVIILKIAGDKAIFVRQKDISKKETPSPPLYMTPTSNIEKLDESKIENISNQVNTRRKAKNLSDKAQDFGSAVIDILKE